MIAVGHYVPAVLYRILFKVAETLLAVFKHSPVVVDSLWMICGTKAFLLANTAHWGLSLLLSEDIQLNYLGSSFYYPRL